MIKHSETMGAIATALAKAQGQIQAASKDAVNPHFRSRYADLASIRAACQAPLSEAGLAVVQGPAIVESGWVSVQTMLIHSESGEWMSTTLAAPPRKQDPQAIGSTVTYLRRYTLACLVGVVADDDDDGNAASHRPQAGASRPLSPIPGRPGPGREAPASPPVKFGGVENQRWFMAALAEIGVEYDALKAWAQANGQPVPSTMHTREALESVLVWLRDGGAQQVGQG